MRWVGHMASMRERKGESRVLMEKPEGKRSFGRTRRRWEYNIKMDFAAIAFGSTSCKFLPVNSRLLQLFT